MVDGGSPSVIDVMVAAVFADPETNGLTGTTTAGDLSLLVIFDREDVVWWSDRTTSATIPVRQVTRCMIEGKDAVDVAYCGYMVSDMTLILLDSSRHELARFMLNEAAPTRRLI